MVMAHHSFTVLQLLFLEVRIIDTMEARTIDTMDSGIMTAIINVTIRLMTKRLVGPETSPHPLLGTISLRRMLRPCLFYISIGLHQIQNKNSCCFLGSTPWKGDGR